jgi:hypothetical protein
LRFPYTTLYIITQFQTTFARGGKNPLAEVTLIIKARRKTLQTFILIRPLYRVYSYAVFFTIHLLFAGVPHFLDLLQ